MPIYEYECKSCSVRFERKQSVHDAPIELCPDCGGPVRKLFFPAGIIFKGSGFYKTDYASGSSSAGASSSASEGSKSEPAKTETKPETKAETSKSPATTEAKPTNS
jgi:putative FmdB family regulatory protein